MADNSDDRMYILPDLSNWRVRPPVFGFGEMVKTGEDKYTLKIKVQMDVPRIVQITDIEPEKEP
jgi:hypothetical protein